MPILRNVNPLGEVDLPLIGRTLAAGEEFEVPDDVAAHLLEQVGNYALVQRADMSGLKIDELKQYAIDHSLDLGGATTKADILAAISAATAPTGGEQPAEPAADAESTDTPTAAADVPADPTEG